MKNISILFMMAMSIFMASCATGTGNTTIADNGNKIVFTEPWDGEAIEEPTIVDGVYQINSASELAWLGEQTIINQDIKFIANIDMGNESFGGIANFNGLMNGNNKSITNLTINSGAHSGLILELSDGGEIRNLSILSGTVKGGGSVGAFVGEATGTVVLTGLINKANVEATVIAAGGIIGLASSGPNRTITINRVQNQGNISVGAGVAGGIIGSTTSSTTMLTDVGNTGTVTADDNSAGGGIIGFGSVVNGITVDKAYNYGRITTSNSGAITGNGGAVANSFYLEGTPPSSGASRLTEEEFISEDSFSGWDFTNVWEIAEDGNYPTLR